MRNEGRVAEEEKGSELRVGINRLRQINFAQLSDDQISTINKLVIESHKIINKFSVEGAECYDSDPENDPKEQRTPSWLKEEKPLKSKRYAEYTEPETESPKKPMRYFTQKNKEPNKQKNTRLPRIKDNGSVGTYESQLESKSQKESREELENGSFFQIVLNPQEFSDEVWRALEGKPPIFSRNEKETSYPSQKHQKDKRERESSPLFGRNGISDDSLDEMDYGISDISSESGQYHKKHKELQKMPGKNERAYMNLNGSTMVFETPKKEPMQMNFTKNIMNSTAFFNKPSKKSGRNDCTNSPPLTLKIEPKPIKENKLFYFQADDTSDHDGDVDSEDSGKGEEEEKMKERRFLGNLKRHSIEQNDIIGLKKRGSVQKIEKIQMPVYGSSKKNQKEEKSLKGEEQDHELDPLRIYHETLEDLRKKQSSKISEESDEGDSGSWQKMRKKEENNERNFVSFKGKLVEKRSSKWNKSENPKGKLETVDLAKFKKRGSSREIKYQKNEKENKEEKVEKEKDSQEEEEEEEGMEPFKIYQELSLETRKANEKTKEQETLTEENLWSVKQSKEEEQVKEEKVKNQREIGSFVEHQKEERNEENESKGKNDKGEELNGGNDKEEEEYKDNGGGRLTISHEDTQRNDGDKANHEEIGEMIENEGNQDQEDSQRDKEIKIETEEAPLEESKQEEKLSPRTLLERALENPEPFGDSENGSNDENEPIEEDNRKELEGFLGFGKENESGLDPIENNQDEPDNQMEDNEKLEEHFKDKEHALKDENINHDGSILKEETNSRNYSNAGYGNSGAISNHPSLHEAQSRSVVQSEEEKQNELRKQMTLKLPVDGSKGTHQSLQGSQSSRLNASQPQSLNETYKTPLVSSRTNRSSLSRRSLVERKFLEIIKKEVESQGARSEKELYDKVMRTLRDSIENMTTLEISEYYDFCLQKSKQLFLKFFKAQTVTQKS